MNIMNMNIMNNMFGKKRIPVKVTNIKRSRKIGIIISDFDDLKKKANEYLCVTNPDDWKSLRVFLEDQTEITSLEYLLSVSSHLLIVSLEPTSMVSQGSLQEAMENYLKAVHALQKYQADEVTKFLEDNKNEKLQLTWQYISKLPTSKSHLSSIAEHPEWFTGCNKLVTSKEEYFRKCAQGRIRSYLRDAKNRLSQNNLPMTAVQEMKNLLEEKKYFACYFDRKDNSFDRLCNSEGRFHCQGHYNKPSCLDEHSINPYDNSESRVLFSTWNLDHVVERVKILTDLCLQISCKNECHYFKYFELLFTRKNLKLVHKNCHVIGPHTDCQLV